MDELLVVAATGFHLKPVLVGENAKTAGDDEMDWEPTAQDPQGVSFAFDLVSIVHIVPRTEDDESSRNLCGSFEAFKIFAKQNRRTYLRHGFDLVLADLMVASDEGFDLKPVVADDNAGFETDDETASEPQGPIINDRLNNDIL